MGKRPFFLRLFPCFLSQPKINNLNVLWVETDVLDLDVQPFSFLIDTFFFARPFQVLVLIQTALSISQKSFLVERWAKILPKHLLLKCVLEVISSFLLGISLLQAVMFPFEISVMISSLFWAVLLCNSLLFVVCLNEEGQTLLSFKQSIWQDPAGSLTNWTSLDQYPCYWNLITSRDGLAKKARKKSEEEKKGALPTILW